MSTTDQQGGEVTSDLADLYDHEIIAIQRVIESLNIDRKRRVNMEAFRKEVVEKFQHIGFKVRVNVYTTNVPDVYIPEVHILDRMEAIEFDPDRQVHEVTRDLLGLGEGGVIHHKKGGRTVVTDPSGLHVVKGWKGKK